MNSNDQGSGLPDSGGQGSGVPPGGAQPPSPFSLGGPESPKNDTQSGAQPSRLKRMVMIGGGLVVVAGLGAAVALLVVGALSDNPADNTAQTDTTQAPADTSTTAVDTDQPVGSTTPDGKVVVRDVSLQEGALQRQYLIVQPADLAEGEQVPLVVAIHGLGVDRFTMKAAAEWEQAVADDRFIAVFPQGSLGSWNAGACCPPASLVGAGDLGFIDRVLADVESAGHVDPEEIYVTGFSNGGIMAYFVACQRSDQISAVAPMAAINVGGCSPSSPVPTLHIHGDPDPTVPYDGRPSAANILVGRQLPPVPDSVAKWATDQGCDPNPEIETSGSGNTEVETRTFTGCDDGIDVELITHPGTGHSWPKDPVDGLDEILTFFGIR